MLESKPVMTIPFLGPPCTIDEKFGGLRDPSFRPVVLVGLGGVFTEVYKDTSRLLASIDYVEARSAINELTAASFSEAIAAVNQPTNRRWPMLSRR
ncbi:acetate--CoA ligase family protein [Halegenticoccus tardaugens]|uniref:acetate--CoA ligase family protein n=1 Tax=Halegenticoccus tardaugens TaxID=2071624 RepID=UPI00100B8B48